MRGASGGKGRQSKRVMGAEVAQVAHLLTLDIWVFQSTSEGVGMVCLSLKCVDSSSLSVDRGRF